MADAGGPFGDVEAEERSTPTTTTTTEAAPRRRSWAMPALAVLVVALAVAVLVAVRADDDDAAQPAATSTTSTSATAAGFTTYRDDEQGFTISYPEEWERLEPPDPDVRLLLSAGGGDSLLVRVVRLQEPVTEDNVADVKAFTDSIVHGSEVQVLQERAVTLGGLPGYYYLYSFTDAGTGEQGVHAHYFLFQGRKMNTLVFQALPADGFNQLAATFDAVAESFRSDPEASSGTTTTEAP